MKTFTHKKLRKNLFDRFINRSFMGKYWKRNLYKILIVIPILKIIFQVGVRSEYDRWAGWTLRSRSS